MIDEITSCTNLPIHSGAIRNCKDALELISLGVDKVVLRSLFDIKHQDEILKIRDTIGKQSIVGSLPAEKTISFTISTAVKDYLLKLTTYLRNK